MTTYLGKSDPATALRVKLTKGQEEPAMDQTSTIEVKLEHRE
jgi:hypothetical protein